MAYTLEFAARSDDYATLDEAVAALRAHAREHPLHEILLHGEDLVRLADYNVITRKITYSDRLVAIAGGRSLATSDRAIRWSDDGRQVVAMRRPTTARDRERLPIAALPSRD